MSIFYPTPQSFQELILNVKDYGAIGDGTTDDTDSIQTAFDEVTSSSTPYVILFPPGTYLISDTLDLSYISSGGEKFLAIHGYGATILQSANLPSFQNQQAAISSYTCSYRVRGFQFRGDSQASQIGVHIGGNAGCVIQDCKFYLLGTGVKYENCYQSTVEYCNVVDCNTGILIDSDSSGRQSVGNTVRNVRISTDNPTAECIVLSGAKDSWIENAVLEGSTCKYHVYLKDDDDSNSGGNVSVTNLYTESQSRTAFKLKLANDTQFVLRGWTPRTGTFSPSEALQRTPYYAMLDLTGSGSDTRVSINDINTDNPRFQARDWAGGTEYQENERVCHSNNVWVASSGDPSIGDEPGVAGEWVDEGAEESYISSDGGNSSGLTFEVTGFKTGNDLYLPSAVSNWESSICPAIRDIRAIDSSGEWVLNRQPRTGTYSTTGVVTSRTFDPDTVDVSGLANIVGTLIADLKSQSLVG